MPSLISNRFTRSLLGLLLAAAAFPLLADGSMKRVATGPDNVAIKGYDTVAYFTEGQAMQGRSEFIANWNGAEWRFASASHRDLFAADPERYAPQFGGFCASGLSKNVMAVADPEAWTIVDGKLYMKFNKGARDRWRPNAAENIEKAEGNWSKFQQLN